MNMEFQMAPTPYIRFDHVTVAYEEMIALEGVALEIPRNSFVGIVGPNGSGKSTFLKSVLGLVMPTVGEIYVGQLCCHALKKVRKEVGYVPQTSQLDSGFPARAFDVVLMGLYPTLGFLKRPGKGEREKALSALDAVGMADLAMRPLGHLSGGQRQRVYIARALVRDPHILLLDEPHTGLDVQSQLSVMELIGKTHRSHKLTTLLVTHDVNMVVDQLDLIICVDRTVRAYGSPDDPRVAEALRALHAGPVHAHGPDSAPRLNGYGGRR